MNPIYGRLAYFLLALLMLFTLIDGVVLRWVFHF